MAEMEMIGGASTSNINQSRRVKSVSKKRKRRTKKASKGKRKSKTRSRRSGKWIDFKFPK